MVNPPPAETLAGVERWHVLRRRAEVGDTSTVAKLAGRQDASMQVEIKGMTEALEQARAAYQAAGVSGQEGLAAVAALEGKARAVLEQVVASIRSLHSSEHLHTLARASAGEGI